jgi:hypothetical protein
VFLVGDRDESLTPPQPLLPAEISQSVTVREAIGDLPAVEPGQSSDSDVVPDTPTSAFQRYAQGELGLMDLLHQMGDRTSAADEDQLRLAL